MDGIQEFPMLMNGYENAKCSFSFWNLTLLKKLIFSDVCDMAGNDEPKTLPVMSPAAAPKEIEDVSLSEENAVSFWNAVRVWSRTNCGNPHVIDVRDAFACSDSRAIDAARMTKRAILLYVVLPSSAGRFGRCTLIH
jgi:hypothetical protein